jgi:hypothetical protein
LDMCPSAGGYAHHGHGCHSMRFWGFIIVGSHPASTATSDGRE